jgi:hypothetical protein
MLYLPPVIMRRISGSFMYVVCAVALGAAQSGRAQNPASADREPSACVSASGPDVGPPGADSATRGAAGRATLGRADSAQHTAVMLFAAVTAQEVRFAREPKICVKMMGDVQLDSVRVVGRRNITSPVVAGTTYRDVYVAVEILGRLNAECISARITGTAAGAAPTGPCASLGLRDSASVRRAPRGSPP